MDTTTTQGSNPENEENSGDASTRYEVVTNDEGEYSIWMVDLPRPSGWQSAGVTGLKAECLEFISTAWTDMTPRSVRERRRTQ